MSQNRSIKDFFRPVPPKKKPAVVDCEVYDGDLIVVAPTVDTAQSKRRRIWSPQTSERVQSPSRRVTASSTPTPLSNASRSKRSTANVTPEASIPATSKWSEPLSAEPSDESKGYEEEQLKSAIAASLDEAVDSSMEYSTAHSRPTSSSLTAARTSFGSLPQSSQSTASKRVISHGEEVVKGSDTDTDSDSSLEDVTSFIPKRPSHPQAVITKRPTHNDGMSSRTRDHKGIRKSTGAAKAPTKTYAFSLDTLVAQSRKEAALKAKVADAKSRLEERAASPAQSNSQLDRGILTALIEGGREENEGEARRVMDALARTDALETKEVWHFFGQQPREASKPFPYISMGNARLNEVFNDPGRREKELLSGFIPSLASRKDLPAELLIWMLDQVCLERRESLVKEYLITLKNSARLINTTFTPAQLQRMFELLGVRPAALSTSRQVLPTKVLPNATLRQVSSNLRHVADLLSSLASVLPTDTRNLAIDLLARSSFDDGVFADVDVRIRIEDALTSLITALPDSEVEETLHTIGKSLFTAISSPALRYQLVASLPYSPYSNSRPHLFRRRLALAYALNSPRWLNEDTTKATIAARVLYSLTISPVYQIKPSTDYVVLGATLNLLDIGIDAGFSDFAFKKSKSRPPEVGSEINRARPRQDATEDPRESEFNANIDLIVKEIRGITAKVVDTGATHMHRTEVKSVAERMIQRLECAVRTRERIMRNQYDQDVGDSEVMTRFVHKVEKKVVDEDVREAHEIVDGDMEI